LAGAGLVVWLAALDEAKVLIGQSMQPVDQGIDGLLGLDNLGIDGGD